MSRIGRIHSRVVFVAVVSLLASACGINPFGLSGDEEVEAGFTATNEGAINVEWPLSDGSTVTVTAPDGTVPGGTAIAVSIKSDAGGFRALGLGSGVDVSYFEGLTGGFDMVLGGGAIQPAQPLRVTRTIPDADVEVIPEVFAVIEGSDGEEPTIVAAERDLTSTGATRSYSYDVPHLSRVFDVMVNPGKLLDGYTNWLSGLSSDGPECVGRELRIQGGVIKADRARASRDRDAGEYEDVVWPCLTTSADGDIEMSLKSNSPTGWEIRAFPTPIASSNSFFGATYLLPQETTKLWFKQSEPPAFVQLQVDPGPTLASSLVFGVETVLGLPGKGARPMVGTALDVFNCVKDQYGLITGGGADVEYMKAQIACTTAIENGAIDGGLKVLLHAVTSGYDVIAGSLVGVLHSTVKSSVYTINVSSDSGQKTMSAKSFKSADGSITCQIGGGIAGSWGGGDRRPDAACLVSPYQGPTVSVDCQANITLAQGAVALVKGAGRLQTICTGGSPWTESPDKFLALEPGARNTLDGITCTAGDRGAITCAEDGSDRGFTISSSGITGTGADLTRMAADRRDPARTELGAEQKWVTKGARLTMSPGGAGELYFNSGAANSITFAIDWEKAADGILLTSRGRIAGSGTMEQLFEPGDTITATMKGTRLVLNDIQSSYGSTYSVELCTPEEASATSCA